MQICIVLGDFPKLKKEHASNMTYDERLGTTLGINCDSGVYLLLKEDVLNIRRGKGISGVEDLNEDKIFYKFYRPKENKEEFLFKEERDDVLENIEKKFTTEDLVITHEERLRFEKECVSKKEIVTERERENLLRLIGALIEIHYRGKDYKKGDGLPNANKISEKFHGQLALNDFSDKGMSDKSFRKLIPEAYNLIMENKEETPKMSIKKISPT